MAICVRNTYAKNYQYLVIGFQVIVENVRDVFWRHSVFHWRRHLLWLGRPRKPKRVGKLKLHFISPLNQFWPTVLNVVLFVVCLSVC